MNRLSDKASYLAQSLGMGTIPGKDPKGVGQVIKTGKKTLNKYLTKIASKSGNWISSAIKHPGALHEELGIPEDEKIPKSTLDAAAKRGGKLGERARLAETLEGMHKH